MKRAVLMPDEKLRDSVGIGDQPPRVLDASRPVEYHILVYGLARGKPVLVKYARIVALDGVTDQPCG